MYRKCRRWKIRRERWYSATREEAALCWERWVGKGWRTFFGFSMDWMCVTSVSYSMEMDVRFLSLVSGCLFFSFCPVFWCEDHSSMISSISYPFSLLSLHPEHLYERSYPMPIGYSISLSHYPWEWLMWTGRAIESWGRKRDSPAHYFDFVLVPLLCSVSTLAEGRDSKTSARKELRITWALHTQMFLIPSVQLQLGRGMTLTLMRLIPLPLWRLMSRREMPKPRDI
jgi:hypothetical protein